MLERTLRGPYAWLVAQNSARLREVIFGHVVHWSREFVRTLMQFVNDAFFIVLLLGALVWASGWPGIATAVVFVLCASAVFAAVRPKQMRLAETKRQALITAHVVITETLRGAKDVKMAGAETEFAKLFGRYVSTYADDDAKGQQWRQLPRLLLEMVAFGAIVGVGLAVVLTGSRGGDTAGVLVLFGLAAIRLLPMVNTVLQSLGTLVAALPLLQELDDVIKETAQKEASGAASSELGRWHNVALDGVSYRYRGESKLALNNVSLTVKRGRSYGVVGLSGAGKSTLIDILTGLIDPSEGAMTVDGHALSAQQRLNWRHQFGCVIQHPMLLDASLKDNIVFGAGREADRARLDRSIALAKLDAVTGRLPGGVEGGIGEQGSGLSGGERQRVAIARALYRGADILILDEATSSLDPLVEREIAESVASLHGEITTIVVSHRLGLVRECDEIWVMEGARIVNRGSHSHLMEHCELYRRMVGVQRETQGAELTNGGEVPDAMLVLAQAAQ
jgi:ABC-type bacteriocin/lantibiotic exporter with double-glycine peptidase domain